LGEVGRPSGGATGWGGEVVTGKLGLDLAGDLHRVFVEDEMAGVEVERNQSLKLVPALAEPRGMRPLIAHCHLGLGKLYRRTGKREQARDALTTATTMYREMGMTYWLEQAETEAKECL
jgi:hypothetical protein